MSNKFVSVLSAIGHGIETFVEKLAGVASKFEKVLVAEAKLKPEFITEAKLLVADAVLVAGAISSAYATKGADWTKDVAAVKAVEKLVADVPQFAKVVEDAIAAIEGAIQ